MFIHRKNLSQYKSTYSRIKRNILEIEQKLNIKILCKKIKPTNIFDDLENHINDKKKINRKTLYFTIYLQLLKLCKDIQNKKIDNTKIKFILFKFEDRKVKMTVYIYKQFT